MELVVGGNAPRLLQPGETPPADPALDPAAAAGAGSPNPSPGAGLPAPSFWNTERAEQAIARAFRVLADRFDDEELLASDLELDFLGEPLAALLQDLLPNIGAGASNTMPTWGKAAVVVIILGLMLAMRAPRIQRHVRAEQRGERPREEAGPEGAGVPRRPRVVDEPEPVEEPVARGGNADRARAAFAGGFVGSGRIGS